MCGIAGVVDLSGQRTVPPGVIRSMAQAIVHRGPDEDGFLEAPGLAFASRRLSIVGLSDGRQPIWNENRSVGVVFNGELFDYPERKAELESRGHHFATHCDTELIPHFWEDHQEGLFDHLRGQFAFALWDRDRQQVVLARDRFGICPLFWTRQTVDGGDWLLFASEIKALLASGWVEPQPDPHGINHLFTFFAVPGPVTCFKGVQALLPGHFLRVDLARRGSIELTPRRYWTVDFPDRGQEDRSPLPKLVDRFEEVMMQSVEKRLRADVPVVSYLSGGIDSSVVVAMACKTRGTPIPTFTIQIDAPGLDETNEAAVVARHLGTKSVIVRVGDDEVRDTYAELIHAAETPVVDTSCTALLLLARQVHAQGYKVALTGEGSDEWLAGYSWYKVHRLLGMLDVIPGARLSLWIRRMILRATGTPQFPAATMSRFRDAAGGHNAWFDIYGLMSANKLRFYSPWMHEQVAHHVPYSDLQPDLDRLKRWDPLNQSLYWGARIHLPGLLLSMKGDRVAMNSSVETRYPFLDEEVFSFLAGIDPRLKLRGLREKYILRVLGERWLPHEAAWRRKGMFRAPLDSFFAGKIPAFVDQLLSPESLRKSGYFDPKAVQEWRERFRTLKVGRLQRIATEMGLAGVVATQLWHHTFIDPSLADLPAWSAPTASGHAPGTNGYSSNLSSSPARADAAAGR